MNIRRGVISDFIASMYGETDYAQRLHRDWGKASDEDVDELYEAICDLQKTLKPVLEEFFSKE